jgi:hypothetical protein
MIVGSGIVVLGGKGWIGVQKLRSRNEKLHILASLIQ